MGAGCLKYGGKYGGGAGLAGGVGPGLSDRPRVGPFDWGSGGLVD